MSGTTLIAVHRSPEAPSPVLRRAGAVMALVVGLALMAGCSGERPTLASTPATTTTTAGTGSGAEPVVADPATPVVPGPDTMLGFIATPLSQPEVFSAPDRSSAPIEVPAETAVGERTTFAVLGDADDPTSAPADWHQVLLPIRPNGAIGWVPAESVEVTHTTFRIFIELEDRRILVEENGVEVFTTFVAIGTEDDPTPIGATYVTELIQTLTPDGAYGPFAFGLALHSDTLTEFAGGPGQVGVHGTNQPDLIGQRVSHGCVRLTNEDIVALVELGLPLAVPVFIS